MNYKLEKLEKKSDERGYLIEFLKNSELDKKEFGQNYFVTFNQKDVVRGNHYHTKKSEWFTIAVGKAEVILKDIETGETEAIILTDEDQKYLTRLYIAPNIAHSFRSLTDRAVLLNYTDIEYHPEDPDTHRYQLT